MSDKRDKKQPNASNYEQTARLRIITSEEIEDTVKGGNRPKESIKDRFVNRKPMKMSSMYRKKYAILWGIILIVFILAYQFVKVRDIDFKELSSQIENRVSMDNMVMGNDATLRKLYGINKLEVEAYTLLAPKSNMEATEILIVKCKKGMTDPVMAKIQARIDAQSNSFKNYAPDQYTIISNSQLKKKGDYIYFISSKNQKAIDEAIKNSYK